MASRVLSRIIAGAAFAALALRQLRFVDRYAVNVLFFDQWGFYYPLFHGQGWWDTFDRRHGPHREGIGLVVTRVLAEMSGWDSRVDAFAVSAAIIAAALLALVLLGRCGNRGGLGAALAVPVLFFNVHQFEAFVGASNLSHGAMPVLLLMAFCLACFIRGDAWRLATLSLLTFLLIFTGFGILAGVVAPLLFGVEAVQAARSGARGHALMASGAFLSVLASWALFRRGYVFDPALANFHFPYEKPLQYAVFSGRMLANFFGLARPGAGPVIFGLSLAAVMAAVCAWHGRRCLMHGVAREPRSAVLFFLSAYEIIYCSSAAVGRVMAGDSAPLASRYVTLLVPVGLVLVLELSSLRRGRAAFWSCLFFTLAIAPGCLVLQAWEMESVNWYHDVKVTWRAAYLATHDEKEADRRAKFVMYPVPLTFELSYLERNRLNLFKPGTGP
jgi:hypothetical protein